MSEAAKALPDPVLHLLYPREVIARAVERLAGRINADYAGRELVAVVVLNGALFFAADLLRRLTVPLELATIQVASYAGMGSTGCVEVVHDVSLPLTGRDLLVIEDIVDTGLTLRKLVSVLEQRSPRSLRVCALLDKPGRRQSPVKLDYAGFTCPDEFIVGYGLDLDGRWRQLPDIHTVVFNTNNGGRDDRSV
jgi:hypoxanthine phosphoribosyltransferase